MLWVTIRVVSRCSATSSLVNLVMSSAREGSSAAVCSSRSRTEGWLCVAIRRLSAWRCPPDSIPTRAASLFSSPSSSVFRASRYSSRLAFVTAMLRPRRLPRSNAIDRFSSIVSCGAVPAIGSWKTRATTLARLCSAVRVTSLSSITICPASIGWRPATTFNSVDLPAPLDPMMVTKSPSSSARLTDFRATRSLTVSGKNRLVTFLTSSIRRPLPSVLRPSAGSASSSNA